MTRGGPLPLLGRQDTTAGLAGWWRGVVEQVDGELVVSVETLSGSGQRVGKVEAAGGLQLAVGDRVWVTGIQGSRTDLVVTAFRLPSAPVISPPAREVRGTAPPSGGSGGFQVVGDTIWNSSPASGAPLGWVCVAAGSPGVWQPMPNLP